MQDFNQIFDNHVLWVALFACIAAQVLKLVFEFAQHRSINPRVLVETGGMPSAHSALVTALACGVGQNDWLEHPGFCCHLRVCRHCDVRRRRGQTGRWQAGQNP